MSEDLTEWLARNLDDASLTRRGRELLSGLDRGSARRITGEQSNTSVIVPNRTGVGGVIVKALRDPAPGTHPDVELPEALWRAGWRRIPEPLGLARAADGSVRSIVTVYLPNAEDGFELASRLAHEGRAFDDAAALGETLREMHDVLRTVFDGADAQPPAEQAPTESAPGASAPGALADRLRRRAEWAIDAVPELAEHRAAIGAAFDDVAALSALPAPQRIHGDFHLGQTLHRRDGWFVLDFEGEPLVPLSQRSLPDHRERDVAGVLRSIDYAAAVGGGRPGWRDASTAGFLTGYGPVNETLLRAFTFDKALYECVYESRNRPDWLPIPLAAIATPS